MTFPSAQRTEPSFANTLLWNGDTILVDRGHAEEDDLELYALEKMDERRRDAIQEHVANCADCRKRLLQVQDYVEVLQEALRRKNAEWPGA